MSRRRRFAFAGLMVPVIAALVALGAWQIQRRAWKHALIATVERRLAASPVAAPGPGSWARIGVDQAYTRIAARGTYVLDADTYVQAVTALGPGFWVLTPLRSAGGFTLLVDRGFVPAAMHGHAPPAPAGPVEIRGLLRADEPGGGFLRRNDPAADRWYSRDAAAIAARRGLGRVAPYFLDAEAGDARGWPRGGLTVVRFPDNHLQYALTWFAMAALLAAVSLRMAFAPAGE